MSPDRQRTPTCCGAKPYSRQTTPDTPSNQRSTDIANEESTQSTLITSKPGFPSYAQYKQIEANYLASLSPNRREKALISQNLFDRIWAVLHTPEKTMETAQFRFWVRNKFAFGTVASQKSAKSDKTQSDKTSTCTDPESEATQTVLLHEKNLVAVQEQIYDILCYSHGTSNHAGRDKTCVAVRKHYTWIPKELVSRFIKACPTCIAKKCGVQNPNDQNATHVLPSLRRYLRGIGNEDDKELSHFQSFLRSTSVAGENSGSETSIWKPKSESVGTPVATLWDRGSNQNAPACVRSPSSLPMSREVSLYQGLPNGWQFRHADLNIAQDEFVHTRKVSLDPSHPTGNVGRPRVPSIAPVVRDSALSTMDDSRLASSHTSGVDADPSSLSPVSLVFAQTLQEQAVQHPMIDPALFSSVDNDASVPETPLKVVERRPGAPPSIYRPAAPPPINLRYLNSQKTIQAFLILRDTHSLTPDSPRTDVLLASPANSESSQLSAFPMTMTDSISPANTALATPTDDITAGLGFSIGLDEEAVKGLLEKKPPVLNARESSEAVCGSAISL